MSLEEIGQNRFWGLLVVARGQWALIDELFYRFAHQNLTGPLEVGQPLHVEVPPLGGVAWAGKVVQGWDCCLPMMKWFDHLVVGCALQV